MWVWGRPVFGTVIGWRRHMATWRQPTACWRHVWPEAGGAHEQAYGYLMMREHVLDASADLGFGGVAAPNIHRHRPAPVPVTAEEVAVFERYFGDLLDELFGPVD